MVNDEQEAISLVAETDMPQLISEAKQIRKLYLDALILTKNTAVEITKSFGKFGRFVENASNLMTMIGEAINQTEELLALKSQWLSDNGCCVPTTMSIGSSLICCAMLCSRDNIDESLSCVLDNEDIISELVAGCRNALKDEGHIIVFDQAIKAAEAESYALSCIGLYSILDLFYEQMTGMKSKNNNDRDKIEKKLRIRDLDKWPLERMIPMQKATTIGAISKLYAGSRGYDAIYKGFAARNRVMHGHDLDEVKIYDVVRLLLAISACSGFDEKIKA